MNSIANEKNPTAKGDKRGSLWRRWDLHLHTPGTKLSNHFNEKSKEPTDEIWNKYIDKLEKSPVDVFGITDYFSCDSSFELIERYRKRYPETTKVFFINIEFRLSELILKKGEHAHIHVIFDNDPKACSKKEINSFLRELKTSRANDKGAEISCSDLKKKTDFEEATINFKDLSKVLKDTFGTEKPYLIAFPAGNNGYHSVDFEKSRQKASIESILKNYDFLFGNKKHRDFFLIADPDRYTPKAVVSGSDAHSFEDLMRLEGNVPNFPPTWIKADTTFFGLKQICYEPENRVFIGRQPEVMVRQEQDKTKFIDTLNIKQIPGYDERKGVWFKDVSLPLSPELTAIIGNKGSGKSAIVDIIGLLGESRQEKHFSFLANDSKNRRFRQRGYAENFEATLEWKAGTPNKKNLNDSSNLNKLNISKLETVRYLPQNYFEQLTNESDIKTFREEIEKIVFSHVEETEKLGTSSFAELEEIKTEENKQKISLLKQNLRELHVEITRLEEQDTPDYRKKLKGEIKAKKEERKALDEGKPKEVPKPEFDATKKKEVDAFTNLLSLLNKKIEEKTTELRNLKTNLQSANSLKERLINLDAYIKEKVKKISDSASALSLDIIKIVTSEINISPVEEKINRLEKKIETLKHKKYSNPIADKNSLNLEALPDLKQAHKNIKEKIDELKKELDPLEHRYQIYIEELEEWKTNRLTICGDDNNPKPDTVKWLEGHQKYIETELKEKLKSKKEERKRIVAEIYESKNQLLNFYSTLTVGIKECLKNIHTDKKKKGFNIAVETSFIIKQNFFKNFLNHINQRKGGPFRITQEATQNLSEKIHKVDWDNFDSAFGFCKNIITEMNKNNFLISEQVDDIKEFYDFLFSFDYLSPSYELRFEKKPLNQLSPGEKGLLLLIFYLQLDRENIPLVIDQPEDNLDNESIFHTLAECIRYAKKRRQIILVTHNPNLAMGADAEQIIYVSIDKLKKNKFSYEVGAIENPNIKNRIVDILEGSHPAFIKRRLKYNIN